MTEYRDYRFEGSRLFLGDKDTGMAYFEWAPKRFIIQWDDEIRSADFYNLERVKDNMKKWHLRYDCRMGVGAN